MWDVVLDALFDTLKLFPFLFVLYVLIEVMEHNTGVGKPRKALTGKIAPALGAALGIVPMCGFSVMAAKLYRNRHITLGTLLAVFITTSDEALLVLLLSPMGVVPKLVTVGVLILSKLALGIGTGYLFDLIFRRLHGSPAPLPDVSHTHGGHAHAHDHENGEEGAHGGAEDAHVGDAVSEDEKEGTHACDVTEETAPEGGIEEAHDDHEHDHVHDHTHDDHEHGDCACDELSPCEHKHTGKVRMYFVSPLLHALQVAGFVLLVNLLFGFLLFWLGGGDADAGAERVGAFMGGAGYWLQPLVCSLVGAIPNCASSVILSEVYALGGIGFGGLLAGLVVNAGLGYLVLLRGKEYKQGLLILGGMMLFGVAVGFAANALALLL